MTLIDAEFPGGRIDVVGESATGSVELEIPADVAGSFRQWFAFRVTGAEEAELSIVNAGEASICGAWDDYQVLAMSSRGGWSRAPTCFDGRRLIIQHRPAGLRTRYAYFATYSEQRLCSLLRQVSTAPWIDAGTLGTTAGGRPLFLVKAGSGARVVWIIARQHPGETPASFAMEGLLRRLSGSGDAAVESLLRRATLYIAPLMNPDGAALGNMRTSGTGADLNRAWDAPAARDAPEVSHALAAIAASGVDLFLDVHADECSPHAFAACSEGNPNFDDVIATQEALVRSTLADLSPEFVDEPYYDLDRPGEADLTCASGQVGALFDCPSITLELPFKDIGSERVRAGWSPGRARCFGASLVDVLDRATPALAR